MSDYCRRSAYDVNHPVGPRACPLNLRYWNFIAPHAERFSTNMRMQFGRERMDIPSASRG